MKKFASNIILGGIILNILFMNNLSAKAEDETMGVITYDCTSKTEEVSNIAYPSIADVDHTYADFPTFDKSLEREFEKDLFDVKNIVNRDSNFTLVNPIASPYCNILLLRLGEDTDNDNIADTWSRGTGFLVGEKVMLTAGHCIWSATDGWVEECRIYKYQNSATLGTNYYYPATLSISQSYVNSSNYNSNFDWGVTTLFDSLGAYGEHFNFKVGGDNIVNSPVTISGYPYVSGMEGFQYKSTGTISGCSTYEYDYTNETAGGYSGSPVYDADYDVIAIHVVTETGVRINSWLYNYIVSKISETEN